jgi:hypothetical protein
LIFPAIILLSVIAASYSLYGGLSAVAWTDVVQVILLIGGGLLTTIIALDFVTPDGGVFTGLSHIYNVAGEKFHMILSRDNPEYFNLPGITVLIGGMWVANFYYWGFNQYIIQRALAAKSLSEAQKGLASDSFKRACFNWGIGRELYTAPFTWIPADKCNIRQNGQRYTCYDKFVCSNLAVYKGEIIGLVIKNSKGNIVFKYQDQEKLKQKQEQEQEKKGIIK